ncbi:MAG: NUDIX domain-containing protein [Patescibacteria group bacterium]
MDAFPKVGVTILIIKDGKFLLGQRMNGMVAEHQFQTPGGHLENGESVIQCAIREVKEETDLEIENIRFACVNNVTAFLPHHYVMICLIADWKSGEPRNCEADKCVDWDWYDISSIPSPLTPASTSVIQAYQTGDYFFDSTFE